MQGCDIRVAIEEERLSRRKHGYCFWYENPVGRSINYCLTASGITLADVGAIVSSDLLPVRVQHALRDYDLKIFPHHLCHAASAYMMLSTDTKAGILVYDGYGSIRNASETNSPRNLRQTFSFFLFGPEGYQCIGSNFGSSYLEPDDFPTGVTNSIGMLYEMVTALLGFDLMDSGKTMGLSSHGQPRYLDVLEKFVEYGACPSKCFSCNTENPEFGRKIEQILTDGKRSFTVKADLAASLQMLVNKTLLHCATFFSGYDINHFCISGGCGLNTVANSFLIEHSSLGVPISIPPHCSDAGIAFGALWLEQFARKNGQAPSLTFRNRAVNYGISRPGRLYTRAECRGAVQEFYPRLFLDQAVRCCQDLANIIASGAIVGVLSGGSEIGPRALGGRSIFADPRSALAREKINRIIKKREPFRPLAPIVLKSEYAKYFADDRCADPFMLKVSRVHKHCITALPAVVHVDETARVQVVDDQYGDPFLIDLLRGFHKTTGVGVLLNTSFNRRGEPLVESPLDAVDAFLGMGLDGLYLDGEFYRPASAVSPST